MKLDFSELKAASLLWERVLRHCTQTGSISIWPALSWSSRSPRAFCREASLQGRPRDRELLLAQRVRGSAWKLCVQGCCLWQMPPESQVASLAGCSPPQDFDEPVHFRDPLKEILCWKLSLEVPSTTCDIMQIWSFFQCLGSVTGQKKENRKFCCFLCLSVIWVRRFLCQLIARQPEKHRAGCSPGLSSLWSLRSRDILDTILSLPNGMAWCTLAQAGPWEDEVFCRLAILLMKIDTQSHLYLSWPRHC